jgi:hypothetical protein
MMRRGSEARFIWIWDIAFRDSAIRALVCVVFNMGEFLERSTWVGRGLRRWR